MLKLAPSRRLFGLTVVAVAAGLGVARADDLQFSRPLQTPNFPVKARQPLPGDDIGTGANRCAALGPGFVAVQGTTTCVKVGGRISIQTTIGPRSSNDLPGLARPAGRDDMADGFNPGAIPTHLRLNDGE